MWVLGVKASFSLKLRSALRHLSRPQINVKAMVFANSKTLIFDEHCFHFIYIYFQVSTRVFNGEGSDVMVINTSAGHSGCIWSHAPAFLPEPGVQAIWNSLLHDLRDLRRTWTCKAWCFKAQLKAASGGKPPRMLYLRSAQTWGPLCWQTPACCSYRQSTHSFQAMLKMSRPVRRQRDISMPLLQCWRVCRHQRNLMVFLRGNIIPKVTHHRDAQAKTTAKVNSKEKQEVIIISIWRPCKNC